MSKRTEGKFPSIASSAITRREFLRLAGSTAALSVVLAACGPGTTSSSTPAASGQAKPNFRIGTALGVSGPDALSTKSSTDGLSLAVAEINAKGGVLGGRMIELIIEDDHAAAADAVTSYNKLHSVDKVALTVGPGSSGETLAAMPVMKADMIPNLGFVATNPTITAQQGVGGNPWSFRMNVPDNIIGSVAGKVYVETLKYKTFSALVSDDDFGRGAFAIQKAAIEASGGKIISTDYVALAETDFLSVLTKIKSLNPDSVLVFLNPDPTLIVGKQYKELGMTIPFSGRGQFFTDQMKTDIGCGVIKGWASLDPWYNTDPAPASQAFVKAIKDKYQTDAVWQHLMAYTAIYVAADAINRAGAEDPKAIRDALAKTNLDTLLGKIQFDDHNQARGNIYAAQMQPDCTLKVIYAG